MTKVDDSYLYNLQAQALADRQTQDLENWFDSIEDPSSDIKAFYDQTLSAINTGLANTLIDIDSQEWGQNISVRSSDAPQQVCYGSCRLGGTVSFLSANQGDTGRWLHIFVTYAGHEIDRVTDLYLDGEKVSFPSTTDGNGRKLFGQASVGSKWENLVFLSAISRGEADQVANSDLVGQSAALFPGKWTSVHRQRGSAGIYLILLYDLEVFKNGIPEIAIEGQWKNDIADPRSSTGYSNNAALCLANYMQDTKFGPGISSSYFDDANLIYAANACDDLNYTINGQFQASRGYGHQAVIADMARAMAGDAVWTGSKWLLYPGKWRAPSLTLDETHLRGAVRLLSKPSKRDIFNAVQGRYRTDKTYWELSDYPIVKNDLYESQDGERIIQQVDLPFTTSALQAQKIAKILLEDSRQWITIDAEFSVEAIQLEAGDNVNITNDRFGFDAKAFKVIKSTPLPKTDSEGGPVLHCQLTLKETASGIYDWNDGDETTIDLAPNTDLPDPSYVIPPENLTIESGTEHQYLRADGTVFSRAYLQWSPTVDPFVLTGGMFEIQYRRTDLSTGWIHAGLVDGAQSNFYVLDLKDGEYYDFRVRAITRYKSAWTTELNHFFIGKTANPSTPTNFTVTIRQGGIFLEWEPIADLDVAAYEVRVGASWSTGTRIETTDGTSFFWKLQQAASYSFWLRAIDTSGNYSNSISNVLDVQAPGKPTDLQGVAVYNMVKLFWLAPTTGTFAIAKYNVRKGPVFSSAELLGSASATFKTFFEATAGTYTYWVTAVDEAGNESLPARLDLKVDAPPLFVLKSNQVLTLSDAVTLTNCVNEDETFVLPVITGRTYQEHFTDNSWTTPEDQINAGYPRYIQPTTTDTSVLEFKVDFGETITGTLINLFYVAEWIDGSGDLELTLSYSADDVSYTDAVDITQVFGDTFRYVKVKFTVDGDDDTSLLVLSQIRLVLDIKQTRDRGTLSAVHTDASGTLIVTNLTFLDIDEDSISLTPVGSSARYASFTISGNDVSVFLWDNSGARVSGDVRWELEGVISDS